MDVQGKRYIPLSPAQTWEALNSLATLRASIPGCESLVQTGPGRFDVVQQLDIAGHKTRFTSVLTLEDANPPHSYVLRFEGNGGQAGFGIGRALIALQPGAEGTQLQYQASAEVGGAIAQMGASMVDGAVKGLIDDFFARFERSVRGEPVLVPQGMVERLWMMMPPWAWALSTLVAVFIIYWGLHGTW
ncbi:MAG: SRPBCC family protein [Betaproteobacteria bacterium]|nr:SRPBCC family protein [Betaproteobacteria bacterium]